MGASTADVRALVPTAPPDVLCSHDAAAWIRSVLVLAAVAGSAGPLAGAVSHVSSPPSTPAIQPTVPPAVLKTALPSKHLPPTTPPPSPRRSCGSGRAARTVVLALPGGRRGKRETTRSGTHTA